MPNRYVLYKSKNIVDGSCSFFLNAIWNDKEYHSNGSIEGRSLVNLAVNCVVENIRINDDDFITTIASPSLNVRRKSIVVCVSADDIELFYRNYKHNLSHGSLGHTKLIEKLNKKL